MRDTFDWLCGVCANAVGDTDANLCVTCIHLHKMRNQIFYLHFAPPSFISFCRSSIRFTIPFITATISSPFPQNFDCIL